MKGNIYMGARSQQEAIDQASTKSQLKVLGESITAGVSGVKSYVQSRGENLVSNGNGLLGDNTNFSTFTFDPVESYAGGGSFYTATQTATLFNDELIPVNPTNEYRLALMAKSKTGLGKHFFMGSCYDIDTLSISPYMAYGSTRPVVTLAAELKTGDTTITLSSVDGFIDNAFGESGGHKHSILFWGYKNSKGYTYPEGTYSRLYRDAMWNDGAINRTTKVITLNKAWNYPNPYDPQGIWRVGHKVSATQSGSSYKYFAASDVFVPTEWTRFEGTIGGTGMNSNQFMPGTAYMLVGGLVNRASSGGTAGDALWLNSIEFYNIMSENKVKEYADAAIKIAKDAIDLTVKKVISGTRVRYVRDWINGSNANTANHWVEIRVMKDGTNLALNKTVTGSTPETSPAFAYSKITNGVINAGEYSSSTGVGLGWVQVDLGSVVADVDHVIVNHYYADSRTYYETKTEVSEDGVNWFPIYDSAASGTYVETVDGQKMYVNPNHALSTAESSIKTSAEKISLVVKSDNTIDGKAVASSINQTANDIKIAASKINIEGAVTFSSFDNSIKSVVASGESDLFNTNQNFLDYPISPGVPTGYANESGATPTRVTSDNSTGYSVQMSPGAGVSNFFAQTITNQAYSEYVTVSATFKLVSGSLDGAGILFRQNRASGYYDFLLGFKTLVPSPVLNKWYTVTKTFKAPTNDFVSYKLYVMGGWTGFEAPVAKTIQFDSVSARAATQGEKDAFTSESSVAGWRMAGKTTINGGSIETNTVTADQILTRTITANEIATRTLTADRIATGALTATEIATNTITAGKLILGDTTNYVSVSENEAKTMVTVFGGTIISGGYVKKTLTANQYLMMSDYIANPFKKDDEVFFKFKGKVASAVTVPLYVFYYNSAGANTGSDVVGNLNMTTTEATYQGSYKIASNAASAAASIHIGFNCINVDLSIKEMEFKKKSTGDLIVNGAITADKIAANAVRAESLYVGDPTNMMQYDEMSYAGPYTVITHTDSQRYLKIGQAAYSTLQMARSERVEFKVGDSYYLSFNGFKDSAITGNINFIIRYYYSDGTFVNAGMSSTAFTTATSALEAIVKINTAPNPAKSLLRVDFFLEKDVTTTGFYYVRNLELRKMMAGKMIVDGTIDAGKVSIRTVTGAQDVAIDSAGITATRGTQKVLMNSTDGFAIKNGTTNMFTVDTAGVVTAANFMMNSGSVPGPSVGSGINASYVNTGTLNAGSATISAGGGSVIINGTGLTATKSATTVVMNATDGFAIKNSGTATFSVDGAGAITANKITLNGTSSTISIGGGVVINSSGIIATRGTVTVDIDSTDGFAIKNSGTATFSTSTDGTITASKLNLIGATSSVNIGGGVLINSAGLTATRGTVTVALNSTEGFVIKNSGTATFSAASDGAITASKMTLNGASTISVGGGVVINSAGLVATGTVGGNSVVTSMNATDGFKIAVGGTTRFSVGSDGNVAASGLTVSGGTINGGTISGSAIDASTLFLTAKTYYPNSTNLTRDINVRVEPITLDQFAYDIEVINIESNIPQQTGNAIVQNLILGFEYFTPIIQSKAQGGLRIKSEGDLDFITNAGFGFTGKAYTGTFNGDYDAKTLNGGKFTIKSEGVSTSYIEIDSKGVTSNNDLKGYINLNAPNAIKMKTLYGLMTVTSNSNVTVDNYKEAMFSLIPDDDATVGIQMFGRRDSVGIYDRKSASTFIRYSKTNDLTMFARNTMEMFVLDADFSTNVSVLKFDGTKDDNGVWVDLGGGSRTIITAGESILNPEGQLGFGPSTESLILEANDSVYMVWATNSGFTKSSSAATMENNSYGIVAQGELFRPMKHDRVHLGGTAYRWKTVWAVNATINSDSRSKHDIQYVQGTQWSEDGFTARLAEQQLPRTRAGEVYDFMKKMPLYQFKYDSLKPNEHQHQFGFMADQLIEHDDNKVADFFIGVPEDKEHMLSVSTQSYAAAIHMTLQQEIERNDTLEKEVKSLRRLLTKIQKQLKEGA